jgi:hypothetical protein
MSPTFKWIIRWLGPSAAMTLVTLFFDYWQGGTPLLQSGEWVGAPTGAIWAVSAIILVVYGRKP